ncbi:hypothetical protein AY600_17750 [Phormidium willei BDU 130791]|nr:hypothetical protein AY600_17750 [Phormidium willei BDU 130791]
MSQSIHFARIKCFSEELTDELTYIDVLRYSKKISGLEKNIDESVEKLAKNVEKLTEDIESEYMSLTAYGEVEELLKTDSKFQLHPELRYYFVTEEVWSALTKEIIGQFQNMEERETYLVMAEDYEKVKSYYNRKMLVFEAS